MTEAATDADSAPPGGVVEVSRTGGVAGMTLRGRLNVDRLAIEPRAAWVAALKDEFPALAQSLPPRAPMAAPDRFVYRVRNQQGGLDLTIAEPDLPDHLRELLDRAVGIGGD